MRTAIATLAALFLAGAARANITITGNGKVTYVPNMAYVHVSVSSDAKTAAAAWQMNGDIVRKMFAALKDFQVDEKDFKTTGMSITPRYIHLKNKEPVLVGYTATYDLQITARQLARLGSLLDRLVECGANRGMGIRFSHDRLEELVEQSRVQAVADARRRAELYVKTAGGSLGALLAVSEGQHFLPPMYRLEHAPASGLAGLPIAGGTQELSMSVTVTYSINNSFVSRS
jgi:uncharacterized protein YggE